MTPTTLVAGSISDDEGLEIARPQGEDVAVYIRYPATSTASNTYSVRVESARLTAALRPTETGWVARAPALDALGYGSSREDALDDLRDAIEQYLEFLREDAPRLAPAVAHHAVYVQLLDAPRAVWFASVDAAALE